MINLFRIELLRHRNLAAGFALVHFVVLYYLGTLGITVHSMPFFTMWSLAMMVIGGGFGIYQMALHKRGNDWISLLHRPLTLNRIFAALAAGGTVVCLLVVVVPPLLMLLIMKGNGLNGIEARHFSLLPFAAVITLCTYFCGWVAQLGSSRISFMALALPAAFIDYWTQPPHPAMPVLLLLFSIALARAALQPDITRVPRRPAAWLLNELPVQYGCLWLIMSVLLLGQEMQAMVAGVDAVRDPPEGSDLQVARLPVRDLMDLALSDSPHPDAAFLRQQIVLGEGAYAGNANFMPGDDSARLPLAYAHLRLMDDAQNAFWIFNHDVMLYAGYDVDSAAFKGWLGPAGFTDAATQPAERFAETPWAEANEFIVGAHAIYQVDWEARRVRKRYENTGHDRFSRSLTLSENITTLLSDSRLYIFSTAELRDIDAPLQPRAIVDTPSNANANNRRISVMELIDGYLVAVLHDLTPTKIATDFVLFGHAGLQVYRTRDDGVNELVASKALPSTFGDAYIYKDFVAAPGMRLLTDMFWGLVRGKEAARTWPAFHDTFPTYIWLLAAAVSLLSATVTAWLLRTSTLPASSRIFWIACNAFTGLAGLLSFVLGYYWRSDRLRAGGGNAA